MYEPSSSVGLLAGAASVSQVSNVELRSLRSHLTETAVTLQSFLTWCLFASNTYAYRMTRTRYRLQSHWESLSSEVWGVIFARLAARPGLHRVLQTFCKLPLVCSKFDSIMCEQPNMCTHLFLSKALAGRHVPHFLGFIKRHSGSVSDLTVSSGYPSLELVLATLLTQQAPISTVSGHIPGQAIQLLAAFKTLTHCHLNGEQAGAMSLLPLKSLPNLTSLDLTTGVFTMVDAAQHLTRLLLMDCEASCFEDCLCVTSLKQLHCHDSDLSRFHQEGLPACSQLRSLVCESSNIHAVNAAERVLFADTDFCVPSSITALTALSSISFTCDAQVRTVELDWLSEFTALETFEAKLEAERVVLPGCISSLSSLRRLSITRTMEDDTQAMDDHMQVIFGFDFSHLVALEEICIHGNFDAEMYGVLNLADLDGLRVVDFSYFTEPTRRMMRQLSLLAFRLGQYRSHIQFTADNEWALS